VKRAPEWRLAVVMDDWPLLRLGVQAVLESLGVRVEQAEVARDGLRALTRTAADLAVVGTMSDLTQGEVIHRAKHASRPPIVVALVAQASRTEIGRLLGAGADALLERSVGPEQLSAALHRLAAGERVLAPSLVPALVGAVDGDGGARVGGGDGLLTGKEREVLARLAEGRSNQAIAAALHVTPATVKTHLAHIYEKLGAGDRHEAIARAVALGLLR
jgi:two-component system, NarL family, nitrate/nitrite response regulator NarL